MMHQSAFGLLGGDLAGSTLPNPMVVGGSVSLAVAQQIFGRRWPVGSGSGGGASPTTTKGDLIVRGASADSRLAVGADGAVPVADSTQSLGVRWATPVLPGSLVYADGTVPAGNTIANTVTETAFTSNYSIPANSLKVGSIIRIRLYGVYSTAVAAPTLILKLKAGAVLLLTTGTLTTTASLTNSGWQVDALLSVIAIGAAGTVEAQGDGAFSTAATTAALVSLTNTAVITVNTTVSETLTVTAQWGTANASNSISLREATIEIMAAAATVTTSSVNITPDTHPTAPSVADDEFEVGTTIDTAGTRASGATAWTGFNLSTASTAISQGSLKLLGALLGSTRSLNGYTQPVAGSWGYTCNFTQHNAQTNSLYGMFVATASGSAGNILVFGTNGATLIVQRLTNATTFSSNVLLSSAVIPQTGPSLSGMMLYYRITYDGTNLKFLLSTSGVEGTFIQVYTETSAAFLGTPTLIGLGGDNESTVQCIGVYDWFRKTS